LSQSQSSTPIDTAKSSSSLAAASVVIWLCC
jgi:hypothetical protein